MAFFETFAVYLGALAALRTILGKRKFEKLLIGTAQSTVAIRIMYLLVISLLALGLSYSFLVGATALANGQGVVTALASFIFPASFFCAFGFLTLEIVKLPRRKKA